MVHNLQWMQAFIERYGVKLAPHGKTTLSPQLFARQLAAGAWGITLGTAGQVRIAHAHGVRRVILANQVVGKANMAILADLLAADPTFECCCLVDSVANVEALGAFFQRRGLALRVLLEYGVMGGRTGVRDEAGEQALLAALSRWPQALKLVGVELYEGVLQTADAVDGFLQHALARTRALHAQGAFAEPQVILSGAGSAWYDRVAAVWGPARDELPLDIVLRPGCYLTHDVGIYKAAQARIDRDNPIAASLQGSLLPALQVWAYVQSRPEPTRVIVALGKRDAAFDAGLPVPSMHYRPGAEAPGDVPDGWALTAMMDQHAFLQVPAEADVQVGDLLGFEISHPCLTFDKWKHLLLVDDAYRVTGAITTFF
ncbi:amino acid deaminase [Pseudomonas sp. RIT-PI-S]|uniref:amino acid deaminase n=1 Tax=Pseudomonas sp. RIT-PI-S TaxID=3035295 RepID=UPI0021DA47D5|nr:amino acid deaminase [Pseudomonas sp. RIT-PI-S]